MTARTPFILSPIERQDPVWRKLRERMEQRVSDLRRDNDNPHDATRTADIRGRIAELTAFLSLDRDPPDLG